MVEPYYQEDGIILYCGDCREILPQFKDKEFDLVLTDPPYGIGADKAQNNAALQRIKACGKTKAGRGWKLYDETNWDNEIPSHECWAEMFRTSINQIVWGGNYFTKFLPPSMGWIVWDKGQRDFSLADGELAWTSFDKALRIITHPRSKALSDGRSHPTQKSLQVIKFCIKFADRGDNEKQSILDPFCGSGTTLVAAKQLGRKAVGIEISEKYCEIAVKRLAQMQLEFR